MDLVLIAIRLIFSALLVVGFGSMISYYASRDDDGPEYY